MPNSSIVLTFTVVDSNNNPLSNIYVQLLNAAGYHAVGSTDSNGMLSGILPANQVLTLNVYGTNNCGIAYTSTIGPFTTDTIVPTVVLGTTAVSSSIVTGTLLKCDNTNVTNGYVLIHYGNQENSVAVTNGIFSFNMMYCNSNNSFTLQGVDFDTVQTTDNINYTFTQTTTNIGVLTACSATTEFISYKIDNQPEVIIFSANAQIIPFNDISISATSANGPIIIYGLNTATPGTYTTSNFTIDGSEFNMGTWLNNSLIFTVSNVGAIGSYIDMTFDGPYQDANGTHTVTGTVHVIRDN